MDKSTKIIRKKHNAKAINYLAKKYGFTERYIRDILSENRRPMFADLIRNEYKEIDNQMNNILKSNNQL